MPQITTLGLDADDTLWLCEDVFRLTEARMFDILSDYADKDHLEHHLFETEKKNLKIYGYGVKGYTLSLIQTALEVTDNKVPQDILRQILEAGRDMAAHPIELLPGVQSTLEALSKSYDLVLITKGDLFHQEQKLAASGLAELFSAVEIVSEKTSDTYHTAFASFGGPASAAMVGNSVKSDILPAIEAGAIGIHIPYKTTWAMEQAEAPVDDPRFFTLSSITDLPGCLETLSLGA